MKPITIKNLIFAYDGQGNLFDHCNLDFNTDWKLGLVGRNGRRETTFLKILQGQLPYLGTVNVDVPIAAFPLPIDDSDELAWDALSDELPTVEEWQVER